MHACRALATVFVFFFSADVGFVCFDGSEELDASLFHGLADTMVHEPRSLLGHANLLGKLDGGDSLPAGRQQIYSNEPLSQRNFALPEHYPGLDREVLLAPGAAIPLAIINSVDCRVPTMRAVVAFAKANLFKKFPARLFVFVLRQESIKAGALRNHSR